MLILINFTSYVGKTKISVVITLTGKVFSQKSILA